MTCSEKKKNVSMSHNVSFYFLFSILTLTNLNDFFLNNFCILFSDEAIWQNRYLHT